MNNQEFKEFKENFKSNIFKTGFRDYRLNWQDGYHDIERKLVAQFNLEHHTDFDLSTLIYGLKENDRMRPAKWLTEHEEKIVLTTIQWLGTPVGRSFLKECGFIMNEDK